MNSQPDYLWDRTSPPDAEIEQLERLLQPLSAKARRLDEHAISLPSRPQFAPTWRRFAMAAAIAVVTVLGVYLAHLYRLSWGENAPWTVNTVRTDGTTQSTLIHVGERVATSSEQTATLAVARIGTVTISPNSEATLIRTENNRHRLQLERGRLRAKVWAPPNYFGVYHDNFEFTDMGCEFDLQIDAPSTGKLTVLSGWVASQIGYRDVLVPEHYSFAFSDEFVEVPVRTDASPEFRSWVNELASGTNDAARTAELSQQIAAAARDEDYYTLDTLLRRQPQLALSPLYPRLAAAYKVDPNESHRARWANGEREAMNEWWRQWPKQPKQWWLNWRDVF